MASIRKEIVVAVPAAQVWDALRDVGALHTRLARGFVTDCRYDGAARTVTFANGLVARETIVSIEEDERRVVWSAAGERLSHHNAAAQALDHGKGGCRLVWRADLLPDAMAPAVAGMMEHGLQAMKATLESAAVENGVNA